MIDIGISEKIRKLKAEFTGDNVDPKSIAQIDEWERLAQKLSLDNDFFTHPRAQEIYNSVKTRIKSILRARLKAQTTEEIKILQAQEDECRGFLRLFNMNYQSELTSLEQIIDAEL
jgi:hypothetical protein